MVVVVAAAAVICWGNNTYADQINFDHIFSFRASSTNTTNPFGSTFCYNLQHMIFEVCAVCIFYFLYFSLFLCFCLLDQISSIPRYLTKVTVVNSTPIRLVDKYKGLCVNPDETISWDKKINALTHLRINAYSSIKTFPKQRWLLSTLQLSLLTWTKVELC